MHTRTPKHRKHFNKYSIALFVAAIFLIPGGWLFAYVWHWRHRPHVLEIYCFSLDGNPAIFIRTPLGRTALIDGGKDDSVIHDLTSVMPFYDRTIDALILTDDDDGHATGLDSVMKRYRIGEVFEMDTVPSSTSPAYAVFENLIADGKIGHEKVGKGDAMNIGELSADVLFPPASLPSLSDAGFKFSKTNAPTLAFEMTYGSTTLFFGGLITKTEQKYIGKSLSLSSPTRLMILPHGENVSAVDEGFFTTVHPDDVIISKKPRQVSAVQSPPKLPKPPFNISDVPGISIINLATDGDVEFISNGETFMEKSR